MTAVVLGPRLTMRPRDVAQIRPEEVIEMVRRALGNSPELAAIRGRVDHDCGRPRGLSVDVLIAASVAAAATNQSNMHVRGVAALLRSLPPPIQRILDIRWVDPRGGGEKLITERQVAYLFGQVARAFNVDLHLHNHLFEQDGDVFTVEGEFVGTIDTLNEADRAVLSCGDTCPRWLSMQALGNRLLTALWRYVGLPETNVWAIDSEVVPTHFATLSWGKTADIAPDWVPDEAKGQVALASGSDGVRRKSPAKPTKKTQAQMQAALATHNAPARNPRSRKPAPIGPTVRGQFTVVSSAFPQLAPDGRLAHTKDPGARNAFQGAGASRRSGIVNGRDKHAFVAAGLLPDGTPFPPFTRAFNAVPGGFDKGRSCLDLLETAEANGVSPSVFSADRIYSAVIKENFQHPLTNAGWTLVRDLKDSQRKVRQWIAGINYLDGWWFTSGMPPGLNDLPRPPMHANRAVRQEHQARFDARRAYTFRVNKKLADGGYRLRGPALPDHVTKNPVTGQVEKVRGVRVRCANSEYVTLLPRTIPQTTCIQGQPCGCSQTFTVPGDEIENSCEPLIWGTTEWAAEYSRRNMSEASFSLDQYHYGMDKNSIRVRAHKWDLAFAMLMLANFVRLFHSWVMRLGAHSLDPGYHSALDPEVFTVALARVLGSSSSRNRPGSPRGKPPSG